MLYVISRLLPTSRGGRPELFRQAKERAYEIKQQTKIHLNALRTQSQKQLEILKHIKSIRNPKIRRASLATFANKKTYNVCKD